MRFLVVKRKRTKEEKEKAKSRAKAVEEYIASRNINTNPDPLFKRGSSFGVTYES